MRIAFEIVVAWVALSCTLGAVLIGIGTASKLRERWSTTMSENVRLSLKLNIVCLLLFLNGAAAVIHHPNWFQ